ncbi:MAG: hypothetical protein ACK5HY_18110 [Parahaliea sp.]
MPCSCATSAIAGGATSVEALGQNLQCGSGLRALLALQKTGRAA